MGLKLARLWADGTGGLSELEGIISSLSLLSLIERKGKKNIFLFFPIGRKGKRKFLHPSQDSSCLRNPRLKIY